MFQQPLQLLSVETYALCAEVLLREPLMDVEVIANNFNTSACCTLHFGYAIPATSTVCDASSTAAYAMCRSLATRRDATRSIVRRVLACHVWISYVKSVLLLLSIRDLIKSGKHWQVCRSVCASLCNRLHPLCGDLPRYVVGHTMHANMEASCSGRCACTAPCHPSRILRSPAAHLHWRAPQALHEHNRCRQVKTHRSAVANRAKRKHRQCVTAAQTSGEVAEVQELHGVRIVADAQRRPQVQYLVVWKDGTPDTWQVPHSSAKSVPCWTQCQISAGFECREPAQNLADNLLRDFEERWWSICRKVKLHSQRGVLKPYMYGNAHDPSATSCRETKRPCTPCSAREPSFWPPQLMRIEGGTCHHLSCTSYVLLGLQHDLYHLASCLYLLYLCASPLFQRHIVACHCSFQTSLTQAFVWSVITSVKNMHAGLVLAAYHTITPCRCREQEVLHIPTDCCVCCSGLHFSAAIGNAECTRMLCEAGADIDLGDKQGDHAAVTYAPQRSK